MKNPRIEKILSQAVSDFIHTEFLFAMKIVQQFYNIRTKIIIFKISPLKYLTFPVGYGNKYID